MIKFEGAGLIIAISEATKKIASAVGEGGLRAAGFAGAEVFRDEAQRNASRSESKPGDGPAKRTGTLHNNIIAKRLPEESGPTRQAYLVTVRAGRFGADGDAFYWRFVEKGHSFVRRAKGKRDSISKRRREAKANELEFGSSRVAARPFMRPAYESKKQEAVDAMKAKLAEKIKEKLGES